jgi:hypothetical protein
LDDASGGPRSPVDGSADRPPVANGEHHDVCTKDGDDEARLMPEAAAADLMATLEAEAEEEHEDAVEG